MASRAAPAALQTAFAQPQRRSDDEEIRVRQREMFSQLGDFDGAAVVVAVGVIGQYARSGIVDDPVVAVMGVALIIAIGAALRLGFLPTVTSACIVLLGVSGAVSIYIPASAPITQACVLTLIALGVIGLFRVRVPLGVALPAIFFVLVASVASVLMIDRSVEFALRG